MIKLLDKYPEARTLILIIKTYLRGWNLNKVYTGGLSSYSITLMVVHMLQTFPSGRYCSSHRPSLGELLIQFFHLYGYLLEYNKVALSFRAGGQYIPKQDCDGREGRLAIQDLHDVVYPCPCYCRCPYPYPLP